MSDVILNVYDISQGMAKQMLGPLIGRNVDGIWHTGVVVYGTEFFFGGGICQMPPKTTPYGYPVKEINLGKTEVPEELFMEYLSNISPEYTPEKYDLINHNCNNFSDDVCNFLLGQGIPREIVDLPRELLSTPMGRMLEPMIKSVTDNIKAQTEGYTGFGPSTHPPAMPSMPQMPGFPPMPSMPQMPTTAPAHPANDKIKDIKTATEYENILNSNLGVIIDFWSPSCGPCMMFKPTYHALAAKNTNPNIVFCEANTQVAQSLSFSLSIHAIPTLHFYYQNKLVGSFQGANAEKLQSEYANLLKLVENSHKHDSLKFKNFTPEHREMRLEDSQKQNANMIKSIISLIQVSPNKEKYAGLEKWLEPGIFTTENPCTEKIMDQIFDLIKEIPLEKRLALVDLLRIIVIFSKLACLHIIRNHFTDVQDLLVSPTAGAISGSDKKIQFLFGYLFKMFSNMYNHPEAAHLLINDTDIYAMQIYLLTTAFDVKNVLVVYSASILAHNMMQSSKDRKIFEENCLDLFSGFLKAMQIENIDDATMYWLGYACALCSFEAPIDTLKKMKENENFGKMAEKIGKSTNTKLSMLAEDLKNLINI